MTALRRPGRLASGLLAAIAAAAGLTACSKPVQSRSAAR
jgi:hypothetical protein